MCIQYELGIQNEAEQRLTDFCQENTPVIANTLFQEHTDRDDCPQGDDCTHGHS